MTFCEPDISDYSIARCTTDYGGIVALGLIEIHEDPSHDDLINPDFWTGQLSVTPNKYWVIRNCRGQYEEIEVIEEEDLIGTTVTGAIHNAVIEVPGLKENRDFWDTIQRHNWKIVMITAGELMYYVDKPVSFYPRFNNQRSIKQQAYFEVQMKWYDLSNPYVLPEPDQVFTGGIVPDLPTGIFDYTFDFTFQ